MQFDLSGEIPWEAHFANTTLLITHQKAAAMRKISLWALRDYVLKVMFPSYGAVGKNIRGAATPPGTSGLIHAEPTQDVAVATTHQHFCAAEDERLGLLPDYGSRDQQRWAGSPMKPRERMRGQLRKAWTDSDERRLRLFALLSSIGG
ncbi:hypothetical protein JX266_013605 [Neoarthrinium moseri]|nr:hypothetical protein JX266_013605 [Neoarthrinium moseri]